MRPFRGFEAIRVFGFWNQGLRVQGIGLEFEV